MQDVGASKPVVGIACQAYDVVMDATHGCTAQHHDAQKGLITSTLAGVWASTYRTKQATEHLMNKCSKGYLCEDF